MSDFPEDVKRFIENTPWTFAKTYAETWPHEYLCRYRNIQTYEYRMKKGSI